MGASLLANIMIFRTYDEIQQVMRRITDIIHKYVPDAEIKMIDTEHAYAQTTVYRPYPFRRRKVKMEFSRKLIEHGTWEQIEDTVAHEIAHVLSADRYRNPIEQHNTEWEDIALALGSNAKITEYYPNVEEPQRYKFRCASCGYTANKETLQNTALFGDVSAHMYDAGHRRWYVLDRITGERWTEVF
jgi:predicted SprT family Zn-dependent metalloprotease